MDKSKGFLFSFIIICIAIGISGMFFFYTNSDSNKVQASEADNVYGWAWSANFGWMALNCYNYYNEVLQDKCSLSGFGLNVNPDTGEIDGYAWSENHGWVDFDASGPYPTGPEYSTRLAEDGLINGWAQVTNLGQSGWIKFLGEDCSTSNNCTVSGNKPAYRLDNDLADGQSSICYNCGRYKKSCIGGARSGNSCDANVDCGEEGICDGNYILDGGGDLFCSLCFSRHSPDVCLENGSPSCLNEQKVPVGNLCSADLSIPKNKIFQCNECVESKNTAPNDDQTITSCGKCPKCFDYGVGINYGTNRLAGWAWNSNGQGNGLGWLQFNPLHTVVQGPWLETRLGGIYSQSSVGSEFSYAPPVTQYSATYEIHAGGSITRFSSQAGDSFSLEDFEELNFPNESNVFANALGRIDFSGINAGQYGQVEYISNDDDIDRRLGGKIYIKEGDLTITKPLVFEEGNAAASSGAGLIIVEGDLIINADINYNDVPIQLLKYLPSVAWIVKGDIILNSSVTNIVGAFIALGNNQIENCPDLSFSSFSCGRFITGTSSSLLDVDGLIMARQFDFKRTYFAPDRGAERVEYDGRAIANTPPGLGDITQVLPVWNSIAPQ